MLNALVHVGDSGVPILGINLGRLGFLATATKEKLSEALDSFLQKNTDVRSVTSLPCRLQLLRPLNLRPMH